MKAGLAKLTEVPLPLARRIDPSRYVVLDLGGGLITCVVLVTGRKLAQQYPVARIVTLITWKGEPILFEGDAESVFLSPADADV
jgi:hypothetical protein